MSRRRFIIGGVVLAGALAGAGVAVSAPGSAVTGGSRGAPISAAVIPKLTKAAIDFAARNGDPKPASITAVASSRARAVAYASGGDRIKSDEPVYLVRMQGEFTANIPVPPGSPVPTGKFLFVLFDAKTLGSIDVSISKADYRASMSTLGVVAKLKG